MNDVFDEDLIKELGLDPEDIHGPKDKAPKNAPSNLKKRPISKARPAPGAAIPAPPPAPKQSPPPPAPPGPKGTPPPDAPQAKAPPSPPKAKTLEPESLEDQATRVSQDIPVYLAAVLAKKSVKLKDILELKTGEILEFKKVPTEPLDLVANGKLIAKAEMVMIDGKIGARIVKLVK